MITAPLTQDSDLSFAMENDIYMRHKAARPIALTLLSDRADQVFFIVTFIVGAMAITFLKAFGSSPFAPLTFSVLLVVCYGFISVLSPRLRLPEERVADNCYYLGFLFTLVSLSNALYYFATEAYSARLLVSDFGVALGSTIAGVVTRIVIQQMRIDTEYISVEVKKSLNETAHETMADLNSFIAEVSLLSQTFKETLTSSVSSVSSDIEKSAELARTIWSRLDDHLKQYEQVALQLEEKNKAAIDALGSAAGAVGVAMMRIESDLKLAADVASTRIAATSIPVPSETFAKLESALQQTTKALEGVSMKISSLDQQVDKSGPLSRVISYLRGK